MAATATVHEAAVPSRSARAATARGLLGGLGWAYPLLGFLGSVAIALAGPRLVDGGAVTWWYSLSLSGGGGANKVLLYLGLGALVLAWLGLGHRLAAPGTPVRLAAPGTPVRLGALWIVGAVWAAPLLVGPALFSQDMYSYLAQGAILQVGLDPYRQAPGVLASHGYRHLLDAVSPFWRTTTAPYGPAFLGLIGVFVGAAGSNLVAGILLARLAEVLGVVLVALFAPRLARVLGADPLRAVWLAALSPLVLVELLAAGHNDALMAGLMLAGVTLALERHPLWGIGLCSLAATVKLPALAAALFIAVAFARSLGDWRARLRFLLPAAAIAVVVLVGAGEATGVGLRWLSGSVLSTPGKVHLAITPSTALGWSLARLLHTLGAHVATKSLESGFGVVGTVVIVLAALAFLWRTRLETVVACLGWALLVAAFAGPAAWPWYFCWGIVLLAATPGHQRSTLLLVLAGPVVFLVKANGILALPLQSAPYVLLAYVLAAAAFALVWRRGRRKALRRDPDRQLDPGASSVLAES